MAKASRDKGKRGERQARDEMNRLFPGAEWSRGQQHRGGPGSPDVIGRTRHVDGGGTLTVPLYLPVKLHVEVKYGDAYKLGSAIDAALAQACKDSAGKPAVTLTRTTRGAWRVVIPLADLPAVCRLLGPLTTKGVS